MIVVCPGFLFPMHAKSMVEGRTAVKVSWRLRVVIALLAGLCIVVLGIGAFVLYAILNSYLASHRAWSPSEVTGIYSVCYRADSGQLCRGELVIRKDGSFVEQYSVNGRQHMHNRGTWSLSRSSGGRTYVAFEGQLVLFDRGPVVPKKREPTIMSPYVFLGTVGLEFAEDYSYIKKQR